MRKWKFADPNKNELGIHDRKSEGQQGSDFLGSNTTTSGSGQKELKSSLSIEELSEIRFLSEKNDSINLTLKLFASKDEEK